MKFKYDNAIVEKASNFLQIYLDKNELLCLTADQSAHLLAKQGILTNQIGPKLGFNFREMLRQGRFGKVNLVSGAFQVRPRSRWHIYNLKMKTNSKLP